MPEDRGGGREELPHAPTPEARGSGREEQLTPEDMILAFSFPFLQTHPTSAHGAFQLQHNLPHCLRQMSNAYYIR